MGRDKRGLNLFSLRRLWKCKKHHYNSNSFRRFLFAKLMTDPLSYRPYAHYYYFPSLTSSLVMHSFILGKVEPTEPTDLKDRLGQARWFHEKRPLPGPLISVLCPEMAFHHISLDILSVVHSHVQIWPASRRLSIECPSLGTTTHCFTYRLMNKFIFAKWTSNEVCGNI